MPQLTTLEVPTQAQLDRIMAAFGGPAAFKLWLINQIKAVVMASEEQVERDAVRARLEAKRARLDQDMTGIT